MPVVASCCLAQPEHARPVKTEQGNECEQIVAQSAKNKRSRLRPRGRLGTRFICHGKNGVADGRGEADRAENIPVAVARISSSHLRASVLRQTAAPAAAAAAAIAVVVVVAAAVVVVAAVVVAAAAADAVAVVVVAVADAAAVGIASVARHHC